MRPRKKAAVGPETSRNWVRRLDEGETPPQIAEADSFDVRTVRKYIAIAQEEREMREARSAVLRQALEMHYADLVGFAGKLEAGLRSPSFSPLRDRGDRLWRALKDHLPRSPLWRGLDRWEALQRERAKTEEQALRRLEEKLQDTSRCGLAGGAQSVEFDTDGLADLVLVRIREVAAPRNAPLQPYVVTIETTSDGFTRLECNARTCATVDGANDAVVKDLIQDLIAAVIEWPEVETLARTLAELERLTRTLSEELITITLRRVVPGRCRYCPL